MAARKIRDILSLNTVAGDLGIEIEMEGARPFPDGQSVEDANWRCEADGSLRGYSMEYIVAEPIKAGQVGAQLQSLRDILTEAKVKPVYSFRAGVHVHINVQDMTPHQLGSFAALYYCLEAPLVKYCGERREGNLFCLRNEDAEFALFTLENALRSGDLALLGTDMLRYSSMNLRAVTRYGSLEFRAMETQPDLSKIEEWCAMLIRLRDAAKLITDRSDIAYQLSFKGPEQWATELLGPELFKLVAYENIGKDIMRGLRMCQTLVYMEN